MPRDNRPTVYSTENDRGDLRNKPAKAAKLLRSVPAKQQLIYLHRESKGRGGKVVSLVKGLQLTDKDLKALSKQLKRACGTGGTIKDGVIEIQGDHRERIASELEKKGFKTRIAGG
jgi:translation initiation factor 1